jgi:hypothetical protein
MQMPNFTSQHLENAMPNERQVIGGVVRRPNGAWEPAPRLVLHLDDVGVTLDVPIVWDGGAFATQEEASLRAEDHARAWSLQHADEQIQRMALISAAVAAGFTVEEAEAAIDALGLVSPAELVEFLQQLAERGPQPLG